MGRPKANGLASPCDTKRSIALRANALRAYEEKSSEVIPPGPRSRVGTTDTHNSTISAPWEYYVRYYALTSMVLFCWIAAMVTYADTCPTVALGSILGGCYTQLSSRSTLHRQVTSTRLTRGPHVYVSTLVWFFLFPNMDGKSTDSTRTHIL